MIKFKKTQISYLFSKKVYMQSTAPGALRICKSGSLFSRSDNLGHDTWPMNMKIFVSNF
jgi:hypothetical protein